MKICGIKNELNIQWQEMVIYNVVTKCSKMALLIRYYRGMVKNNDMQNGSQCTAFK